MPMKANKIEPQSQTRKQKKDTPWILHIFNHICFVTTIIGCYSCHWKIKQEKKFKHGQCCSLRERLFYPCLVISFCMSVLLVFVWVESSNEYNGFDWVIFIGTGLWFFWSIVLLSFLGILAAYTSLLLVLGFLLLWEGIELYLHWCHKILILLVIVICSFFFWILFTYWKDRWLTVGLSLQIKPFFGMKPLSEADRERAGNQKIPKLTELLELAQKEKKFVIFDLYGPAPNHSLRALYVHHVVSTILDSQIEQRLIFWLPGFEREYVKKKAPGFQQVSRLRSVERLTKENITRINVDYKNLFYNGMREYRAANISINLYLVNEPWLFSLAWCSRIPSVTTDNIQVLNEMTQPSYFMTPKYYLFVWILMDILSAVFIVAIFYFHWWKESKKEKVLKSTSIHTESLSTSLRTGKSKNQGPSCISIDPVSRVMEIPWTHAALSPALTKNVRKYPGFNRVSVVPMKKASKPEPVSKTIKTPVTGEDDIRQLVPTLKASESIQAPVRESAREATFQSSAMKANGTFSSIDVSHPQKQTERPPSTKSSEESLPVFTTSSPSSFS
ncbi:glycerophosphodiester phosphodiesterase domain-containing protein 4 isoform X7 [Bubalus bubalis]|uniref:glycerophosphodiester phosphodiesterase domain-containing protein 4 isoform X7 n=1 Tax=Bubalus bubalis TaxID=89462 RepID=UPI001E1B6F2A|nr:glycerophosphodiester phosphodiesterase domain-containing protein 4 isoform X7 [Bubalus bubalis]